jgi:cellulose synthase/poly-beta-1,6-N-acetylglucosamine synthase-like glycosyltransferase
MIALLLLAIPGVLLSVFALYEIVLMVASFAWLLVRRPPTPAATPTTRFLVAIPAHNEGKLIADTVESVRAADYPAGQLQVVVIADNCSDDTAAYARAAHAICFERNDPSRPGKPQALHWIFNQVDLANVDSVVIIDADTVVDRQYFRVMDARLRSGERAIQGHYGVMNPEESWLTRLSVLPATLNSYLMFPGKRALGLSCPLAGNGMCFDAAIIRSLGWNAFTLSEDWEYYLILVTHGYQVTSAPDAVIYGQVARSLDLGKAQRMRWMKGRIDATNIHWRALLRAAVTRVSAAPLDALFDVARPTHAILFAWSIVYVLVCGAVWLAYPPALGVFLFALAILGAQVFYFLAGLIVARPPLQTWLALAMVPWYLLWKLSVTAKGLVTLRDRRWVKTTRN